MWQSAVITGIYEYLNEESAATKPRHKCTAAKECLDVV